MGITNRQGAKGNPAMRLTKDLHRAVHDAKARLRATKGMGRKDYLKRGKDEIIIMYRSMQEVLVENKKDITQNQLRQMRKQAIKFAKK